MKVKDDFDLSVLLNYGFEKVDKVQAGNDGDYDLARYEYAFCVGHSRRGQYYYIAVNEQRRVHVFATKPDGSGGPVPMPDVLFSLVSEKIFVASEEN